MPDVLEPKHGSTFQVDCTASPVGSFRAGAGSVSVTIGQRIRRLGREEMWDCVAIHCKEEDAASLRCGSCCAIPTGIGPCRWPVFAPSRELIHRYLLSSLCSSTWSTFEDEEHGMVRHLWGVRVGFPTGQALQQKILESMTVGHKKQKTKSLSAMHKGNALDISEVWPLNEPPRADGFPTNAASARKRTSPAVTVCREWF